MLTFKMHFIRSGAVDLGEDKILLGQLDLDLCEQGVHDLSQLKEKYYYPPVQVVYSSPLVRALQTADILYPDSQIITQRELSDIDLGDFSGKTISDLKADRDFLAWINNAGENPPPGGERIQNFNERIVVGVDSILREMMDQRLTNVAVITHNGAIMPLLANIALPRQPIENWACPYGHGFTLMFTPQIWMRDRLAEVVGIIPNENTENENADSDYGDYY